MQAPSGLREDKYCLSLACLKDCPFLRTFRGNGVLYVQRHLRCADLVLLCLLRQNHVTLQRLHYDICHKVLITLPHICFCLIRWSFLKQTCPSPSVDPRWSRVRIHLRFWCAKNQPVERRCYGIWGIRNCHTGLHTQIVGCVEHKISAWCLLSCCHWKAGPM
jgi:hypothetical protein